MHEQYLVPFLQGKANDHRGRSHIDILAFSNKELEYWHDYIQWIFPLTEKSSGMPRAPFLEDNEVFKLLKTDQVVLGNLRAAIARLKRFYTEVDFWICEYDHNHRRITRILKSAVLFGLSQEAEDFYNFIIERIESQEIVSLEVQNLWKKSINPTRTSRV